MTQEELVIAIRVAAENADQTIEDIKSSMEELGATVDSVKKSGEGAFQPMQKGANEAAAAQATLAAAAGTAFAAIVKAVNGGTDAYNQYTAATKGLESIASGKGINQDAMSKSLEKVTDEFLNASAAATAYKNLLSRGFSLEQATTTIERLKDAAAFGRAANLSLADAVVTATEGLRQENSVLVDNAGVTKNVAKMWEEYAKARGLSTASLTQSQKVEAEYLGIIQETQLQVGDLAKASDTLAGTQAENAAVATELAATYGDAMAPAMQIVTETTTTMMEGLKDIASTAPGITSGLTAAAAAMALYVTATKAAAAAQTLFAAGTSLISGPMVAIAAGVGLVTAAYTSYTKAQEKAAKAQEEAAQAAETERRAQEEKATSLGQQAQELERLGKVYKDLTSKQELNLGQQKRLNEVVSTLVTQYGISETALAGLAGEYDSGNAAIQDRIRLLEAEQRAIVQTQIENDKAALAQAQSQRAIKEAQIQNRIDTGMGASGLFEGVQTFGPDNMFSDWQSSLNAWLNTVRVNAPDAYEEMYAASLEWLAAMDGDTSEAQKLFDAWIAGMHAEKDALASETSELEARIAANQARLEGMTGSNTGKTYTGSDGATPTSTKIYDDGGVLEDAEKTVTVYQDILQSMVAMDESLSNIRTLQSESANYEEKRAAAIALQREGYGYLLGDTEAIAGALALMIEQADAQLSAYYDQRAELERQLELIEEAHDAGEIDNSSYLVMAEQIEAQLAQTADGTLKASKSMKELGKEADNTGDDIKSLTKQTQDLEKRVKDALDFKKQISDMKDLAEAAKDSGKGWDDLSDEVKDFGKRMGVMDGDLDGLIAGLTNMEAQSEMSVNGLIAELQGIYSELNTLSYELMSIPPAELTADASQLIAEVNAAMSFVSKLLAMLGAAGIGLIGSKGGGRGGGGSRAPANYDSGASAARSAEREQEEAYQRELERIEHRRHMGEITAKQEITELERVKREYAKTADQIMDIDERIYDARQELREEESEKITTLYDSIVDALEERYEEQREIEQRRIEDSIAAWEKWSDDTCAAIQKQIDALDEQVEAEDRAAVEAEHLRKIASLQEALIYETDEYDQKQLQKQIVQAQESWEKQQKDWAVEDQREALEEQMKAIEDRADAEIEALEKESERIDSIYDEMVKGQSLAAEAQKILMESSQEDLLALLASYAPDYEATGRSLGEKIYEGFQSAFGDITAWFKDIDAQFEEMAEKAQYAAFGTTVDMQSSGQTAAQVSSPTINQTVNFNQPVESAADVTRRMQQVSEELAGMV